MIEVSFNEDKMCLQISGHAEFGEGGKDIVCSAMSILFYTLAENLEQAKEMLVKGPSVHMNNGYGYISCTPKSEFKPNVDLIYIVILNGIQLLADNYSENIKIIADQG